MGEGIELGGRGETFKNLNSHILDWDCHSAPFHMNLVCERISTGVLEGSVGNVQVGSCRGKGCRFGDPRAEENFILCNCRCRRTFGAFK